MSLFQIILIGDWGKKYQFKGKATGIISMEHVTWLERIFTGGTHPQSCVWTQLERENKGHLQGLQMQWFCFHQAGEQLCPFFKKKALATVTEDLVYPRLGYCAAIVGLCLRTVWFRILEAARHLMWEGSWESIRPVQKLTIFSWFPGTV